MFSKVKVGGASLAISGSHSYSASSVRDTSEESLTKDAEDECGLRSQIAAFLLDVVPA